MELKGEAEVEAAAAEEGPELTFEMGTIAVDSSVDSSVDWVRAVAGLIQTAMEAAWREWKAIPLM